MSTPRKILVGVDGSPASGGALREGVRIARRSGGAVEALYVLDALVVEDLKTALPAGSGDVAEHVVRGGKEMVERLVEAAEPEGVRVDVRVEVGEAAPRILERAKEMGADLLALGVAEATGGPGGVALRCARHAGNRVLLVRESHRAPFRRVVACVDFSETSRLALREAARFAKEDGAALDVVHAYAPPWDVLHWRAPTREAAPGFPERYVATLQRYLETFVEPLATDLRGLKVERHLVEDLKPAQGVVRFLRSRKADLAVVGTRGRSRIAYALLGTTAERILRDAPCSVLAVRPPA